MKELKSPPPCVPSHGLALMVISFDRQLREARQKELERIAEEIPLPDVEAVYGQMADYVLAHKREGMSLSSPQIVEAFAELADLPESFAEYEERYSEFQMKCILDLIAQTAGNFWFLKEMDDENQG